MTDLFQKRLRELAHDRLAGAREVVGWLLDVLRDQLEDHDAEGDPAAGRKMLLDAARVIIPSQPSMAPLLRVMDTLFHAAESGAPLIDTIDALTERLDHSLTDISTKALPRLGKVTSLATMSWSTTVIHILEKLGRPIDVIVAESRPGGEGRRTAERAAGMGHRVTFHADTTFPGAAAATDLLLLGGDALTPSGLINKVGSRAAARECRARSKPVVAVVDPLKTLGAGLAERLRVLPQDAISLWERPPRSVHVVCHYFELVPAALLSEVIGIGDVTDPAAAIRTISDAPPAAAWTEVPMPGGGSMVI
ncbi:MAG: hypothetical protein AB7K09_13825 [Planctomycetota bacterium]